MALNQQKIMHLTMQEFVKNKIIWAGHVASMGERKKNRTEFSSEILNEKDCLKYLDVNGG